MLIADLVKSYTSIALSSHDPAIGGLDWLCMHQKVTERTRVFHFRPRGYTALDTDSSNNLPDVLVPFMNTGT